MRLTTLICRVLLLSGVLVALIPAGCFQSQLPKPQGAGPIDAATLERVLREIIATECDVEPSSIDMKRPFMSPPLNADGPQIGNISIRLQQKLDFRFTVDEIEERSKGPTGNGIREETPERLLEFAKKALARLQGV